MSPFVLSDADLASNEVGRKRRANVTVAEAVEAAVADLFADFAQAVQDRDQGRMDLIRAYAAELDESLVDELDGFDYLAAA